MTLEEIRGQDSAMENADRVQSAGAALGELLLAAKKQDYLTVGVYESAKVMNVDPDSVAFCVLATDDEYQCDIALQIHFTLIQAFCFDNDINVVRVNDIARLADLVGADESGEPKDAHCILVTVRLSLLPPPSTHSVTAEPQCKPVEGPSSGQAEPVLRGEPQRVRLGAHHHPAGALKGTRQRTTFFAR
ncbi:growth arrest and DNA-damage-inducible, gamma a isoform X1 [Nelusetta ayraudi]|uniref:growth arrest and DNA-damage-inducible, gamma a isoform X1 n=1 Tax=Nelusetta ayraudi TaxID=303726 RepID=UPI003F72EF0E